MHRAKKARHSLYERTWQLWPMGLLFVDGKNTLMKDSNSVCQGERYSGILGYASYYYFLFEFERSSYHIERLTNHIEHSTFYLDCSTFYLDCSTLYVQRFMHISSDRDKLSALIVTSRNRHHYFDGQYNRSNTYAKCLK